MAKIAKKASSSIVKEAAVSYKTNRDVHWNKSSKLQRVKDTPEQNRLSVAKSASKENENSIIYWLGGAALLNSSLRSDFDLLYAGSTGIPKASVDELATHLGVSRKSMAEDILDLSVKTLERKAPADKLDKRTSSHALEIAKVVQHAYEVFEDEEKLRRWINKENRALNGMKPLALFDTLTGLNMVNDTLGRIEEGVYS
jgi:putative toxin-antitoxin system antitoxin component (TIGR02293 family)